MDNLEIDEAASLYLPEEHTVFVTDRTVTDSEDAGEGRRRAWTQTLGCVFLGKLGETIITPHLHMVTLVMDQDLLQALTDPAHGALHEGQVPDVLQGALARLEWNGERILDKAMTSFRLSLRSELMPRLLSEVCQLLSTEQDRHKVQALAEHLLDQYDIKLFGLDVGSLIFILQHPSTEDAEETLRQGERQRQLQKALVSFLPEWAVVLAGWTVASYTKTAGDGAAQFGWKAARVVPFAASLLPQGARSAGSPGRDSSHPVSTPVKEISPQRVAGPTVSDSDNSEREGLPVGIVNPLLSTPSDVPHPQAQRKQFEENSTQTVLERRGAWWDGMSWTPLQVALCVALPVLVSLLLLPLMPRWSTAVPNTAVPNTAVPNTAVPNTAVPNTAVPNTAVPNTAVPNTAVPNTAVPNTAVPNTAVPNTAVPNTAVPNMAVPNTAVPNTAVPNTAVPNTAVPNTAVPNTAVPNTAVPNTAVPNTAVPNTAVPNTAVPNTAVPNTAVPNTAVHNTAVHNTAKRVVLQTLDPSSSSLCGQHACSSRYDDCVKDVLVTADRRVVLAMEKQRSLVVKSSSGDQTFHLGCVPVGLTQLPSGPVAVICTFTRGLLLVSLDGSDPQIQRIQIRKKYQNVAAHPVDNTLIVRAWPDNSIDIITLQGNVVRTLVDSSQLSLNDITSLAVVGENLLVSGKRSLQILQISLSDSRQSLVKILPGTFPSDPEDSAVDKDGNVFVVLLDGSVMVRTTEGHVRSLRTGRVDGTKHRWCHIAVQDNRLLVVTVTGTMDRWKSDVTELQLVDQ